MRNEALKKLPRRALACLLLCCAVPALASAQPKERSRSGVRSASLGVLSDAYDHFLSPLFWERNPSGTLSVYTGIDDTTLSVAFAGNVAKDLYAAFLFEERITNYKWWPQNMTDESWTVLVGWRNLALKGGYYDFCYSGGKGTAQPYLFAGGKWRAGGRLLRAAVGFDVAMQFASGNKMDVYQPQGHVLAFFGQDADNGWGAEYRVMGTLASAHNVTDVEDAPLRHELSLRYGKVWQAAPRLSVGLRPELRAGINAVNPAARLNNFLPERGEFELYAAFPLALEFRPGRQGALSLVAALGADIYYASFDHIGHTGTGGSNYAGWVPGIMLGLGGRLDIAGRCVVQLGMSVTARPELTADHSEHEYDIDEISLFSLLEAPLSLSVQLRL